MPKTFATYLSELVEVSSLGAGDKVPVLESSAVKYVDGGDIGGALATVEAKTADFTANGASGTIYAMDATGGNVVATLENSTTGTAYTFLATVQDNLLIVRPATGHTIKYNDFSDSGQTATDSVGINLAQTASVVTVLKTGATTWYAINSNLIEPES